ncbi:MAG: RnfABCDGE type electron transport complex subunit D [Lachnospiraceae bacterium]|nr:RnfABCDGE type electron transport complex subunit D [Lachnospiraceae bacterium]
MASVSATPHIRSKASTAGIMGGVIFSLLPASVGGIVNFGPKALLLIVISIASCVFFEWGFEKLAKKKSTVGDLSAVLTGLLLALNLPVSVPWWMPVVGAFVAIVVIKMLFGGLGQNFMNPALGARCFLVISFSKLMTDFSYRPGWGEVADAVSGPTPLMAVKSGEAFNLSSMFIGNEAGTIGETSALLLLIGGMMLILSGIITWHLTFSYLISFVIFLMIFSGYGMNMYYIGAQLYGGGLMLGAFFMATDYVTRPISRSGQLIYGVFLGIMTGIFRLFGPGAEGVSYAIILGNLIVPLIDKLTIPKHFGYKKEAAR